MEILSMQFRQLVLIDVPRKASVSFCIFPDVSGGQSPHIAFRTEGPVGIPISLRNLPKVAFVLALVKVIERQVVEGIRVSLLVKECFRHLYVSDHTRNPDPEDS
jgi:hypothetical protein